MLKISALSPLPKLSLWILSVAVLAAVVQLVTLTLGLDFNVLTGKGRSVLLVIALGTLLALLAADRRAASDFGLFVGPRWKKLFFGGLAIGIGTFGGYLLLAVLLGAYTVRTDGITPYRCVKALLAAGTSIPLAITEQFIFSGYLICMLRDRYSRATAVIVPALLFAVLTQIHSPAGLLAANTQLLIVGVFLAATLLGLLRLSTGTIIMPAGLLAGWLMVDRVTDKLLLLGPVKESAWYYWATPFGDPRRGVLMWSLIAVGIVAVALQLWRRGEGKIPTVMPDLDTDFKRLFPLSNANMLAPLDVWISELRRARFRVGLAYVPRLIAVLIFSCVSTLLSLPERLVGPLLLRNRKVPDPVFLLGVHRSGTTHLHNMLALDPQFCTPRMYQTMNPLGFLASGWLLVPFFGAFMPWRRPMDAVRLHIFTPQEDEYAMASSCRLSPWWGMTFPHQWDWYDRFLFPGRLNNDEKEAWKRHYTNFLRRLVWRSGKRPVLKNPYNTGRVALLREMFPRARFIHTCRNPYIVYRSNMHMAKEGHVGNQIQDPDPLDNYQTRFLNNYRAMEDAFAADSRDLAPDQVAKASFESLEHDPVGEIRRIYATLKLDFSERFEQRLNEYLESVADYQKNRHKPLPPEQRAHIESVMGPYIQQWGYANPDGIVDHRKQNKAA